MASFCESQQGFMSPLHCSPQPSSVHDHSNRLTTCSTFPLAHSPTRPLAHPRLYSLLQKFPNFLTVFIVVVLSIPYRQPALSAHHCIPSPPKSYVSHPRLLMARSKAALPLISLLKSEHGFHRRRFFDTYTRGENVIPFFSESFLPKCYRRGANHNYPISNICYFIALKK